MNDGDRVVHDIDTSSISRKRILVQGFRIFESLSEQDHKSGDVLDSPSFCFFFAIDGRAEAGKRVYSPMVAHDNIIADYDISVHSAREERVWREITTRKSALEIVVDYAPHLRVLICDPLENYSKTGLELDFAYYCLYGSQTCTSCLECSPFRLCSCEEALGRQTV